jgi:hypothetical protein
LVASHPREPPREPLPSPKKSVNGRWRGVLPKFDFVGDAPPTTRGMSLFLGLERRARNHPSANKSNAPATAPIPIPILAPSPSPVVCSDARGVVLGVEMVLIIVDIDVGCAANVTMVVKATLGVVVVAAEITAELLGVESEVPFLT